jgi:putative iron-dependent peroxidase
MPYGTVSGDHGLLFIAYTNNLQNFNVMLDRMTGKPDGKHDSIMKYSRNVFGNYFYLPSQEELKTLKA